MKHFKVGDAAPNWSGKNQNGETVSAKGVAGKKVVIYFYPQDDTPTCTVQACNLRDNYVLLKKEGFTIIGISPDAEAKHKKFETKYDLPFTLIADDKLKINNLNLGSTTNKDINIVLT